MVTSVLNNLYNRNYWIDVLDFFELRSFRQKEKLKAYKSIVETESYIDIADSILSGKYFFQLPIKIVVNKFQTGKKKTVYLFDYQDDFVLKVINRILTNEFAHEISPVCHSFQKKKGAKSAFKSLLSDKEIDKKYCLKTDISNFFNNVDIQDFIESLPQSIKNDEVLLNLIKQLLQNKKAKLKDGCIVEEQKGLMAGCPLSPFLSNIYLKSLDEYFQMHGVSYMRYSDDIVVFDFETKINDHFNYIVDYLDKRKLKINQSKTTITEAGKPTEFLGFSYHLGSIDLSAISVAKMKSKVKRLSRAFHRRIVKKKMSESEALQKFIRRINRKLYGIDAVENELCWAHWFFPVINSVNAIEKLDSYIQQCLRYTITGRYSRLNYRNVPYQLIRDSGYIPLRTAYFAYKTDFEKYSLLLAKNSFQIETNISNQTRYFSSSAISSEE